MNHMTIDKSTVKKADTSAICSVIAVFWHEHNLKKKKNWHFSATTSG